MYSDGKEPLAGAGEVSSGGAAAATGAHRGPKARLRSRAHLASAAGATGADAEVDSEDGAASEAEEVEESGAGDAAAVTGSEESGKGSGASEYKPGHDTAEEDRVDEDSGSPTGAEGIDPSSIITRLPADEAADEPLPIAERAGITVFPFFKTGVEALAAETDVEVALSKYLFGMLESAIVRGDNSAFRDLVPDVRGRYLTLRYSALNKGAMARKGILDVNKREVHAFFAKVAQAASLLQSKQPIKTERGDFIVAFSPAECLARYQHMQRSLLSEVEQDVTRAWGDSLSDLSGGDDTRDALIRGSFTPATALASSIFLDTVARGVLSDAQVDGLEARKRSGRLDTHAYNQILKASLQRRISILLHFMDSEEGLPEYNPGRALTLEEQLEYRAEQVEYDFASGSGEMLPLDMLGHLIDPIQRGLARKIELNASDRSEARRSAVERVAKLLEEHDGSAENKHALKIALSTVYTEISVHCVSIVLRGFAEDLVGMLRMFERPRADRFELAIRQESDMTIMTMSELRYILALSKAGFQHVLRERSRELLVTGSDAYLDKAGIRSSFDADQLNSMLEELVKRGVDQISPILREFFALPLAQSGLQQKTVDALTEISMRHKDRADILTARVGDSLRSDEYTRFTECVTRADSFFDSGEVSRRKALEKALSKLSKCKKRWRHIKACLGDHPEEDTLVGLLAHAQGPFAGAVRAEWVKSWINSGFTPWSVGPSGSVLQLITSYATSIHMLYRALVAGAYDVTHQSEAMGQEPRVVSPATNAYKRVYQEREAEKQELWLTVYRQLRDLSFLMGSPEGQAYLERLVERFQASIGDSDERALPYIRALAQRYWILTVIGADLALVQEMIQHSWDYLSCPVLLDVEKARCKGMAPSVVSRAVGEFLTGLTAHRVWLFPTPFGMRPSLAIASSISAHGPFERDGALRSSMEEEFSRDQGWKMRNKLAMELLNCLRLDRSVADKVDEAVALRDRAYGELSTEKGLREQAERDRERALERLEILEGVLRDLGRDPTAEITAKLQGHHREAMAIRRAGSMPLAVEHATVTEHTS